MTEISISELGCYKCSVTLGKAVNKAKSHFQAV